MHDDDNGGGLTNLLEFNFALKIVFLNVSDWLFQMTIQKLVLVIRSVGTNEVVERWQFEVKCEKSSEDGR